MIIREDPALARNNKRVSLKIQGQSPEEILAVKTAIDTFLPGVVMTTGIKPNLYPTKQEKSRWDYAYYAYVVVSFELVASSSGAPIARPTQRNAVLAFQEGRAS